MESKDELSNIKYYPLLVTLGYLYNYININYPYLHKFKSIKTFLETIKILFSRCFNYGQDESNSLKIDDNIEYELPTLTNEYARAVIMKYRIRPLNNVYMMLTEKEVMILITPGEPDIETRLKNSDKLWFNKNECYNMFLSPEECNKALESLYVFLENPIQSRWIPINMDKQLIEQLTKVASCTQDLRKDNPEILVMNVVRSDMFEHALFTTNVETKTIGHTLLFFKDTKMPLVLPIYNKGYINEKDVQEMEHNTENKRACGNMDRNRRL